MSSELASLHESIDRLVVDRDEDESRIVSLLRQCGEARSISQGKRLHAYLREVGKDSTTFVGNWVIQMYGKCGSIDSAAAAFAQLKRKNLFSWNIMLAAYAQSGHMLEAKSLFDKMSMRNLVSWNSIITGYAQIGDSSDANFCYRCVLAEGLRPDRISYVAALQSCSCLADAKIIHSHTIESGLESDTVIATALVVMYGNCRDVDAARRCFEKIPNPDTVLWNAFITANARSGHLAEAEKVFAGLRKRDVASYTAMVTGYAENGHLEMAREVFERAPQKNVVSWNAILGAYCDGEKFDEALELFRRMKRDRVAPNRITCIRALDICARLRDLELGREIESFAIEAGFGTDTVLSNALMNMFSKCQDLESALKAYERATIRNLVSWNSLLAAYAQTGHDKEAVYQFKLMELEGIQANDVSFSTFFDACSRSNALGDAKSVHTDLIGTPYLCELPVVNSLVSMYGKCGSVEDAEATFRDMKCRNVISWTGMITAYAQNGHNTKALETLHAMNLDGICPNEITFVSVLSACSHGGLSERGLSYLSSMLGDYGLVPTSDHFVCAVDGVGRSGEVGEASRLVKDMPFEPDPVSWTSILGACSVQKEATLGAAAAGEFRDLDPESDASYVMESKLCL